MEKIKNKNGEDRYCGLKPFSVGLESDSELRTYDVVGQPDLTIIVDILHKDVSLNEPGFVRKFIYVEDGSHYQKSSPWDTPRISRVYLSQSELLEDLLQLRIKEDFISEIRDRGKVNFPRGMRC